MTKNKLEIELNGKIDLFDKKLESLKEEFATARRGRLDTSHLSSERAVVSAQRQMCVQFLADLDCLD